MSDMKELVWFPVDMDNLPKEVKPKWAALVKANTAAKEAKADFEAAFTVAAKKAERIDADVELAFGYRFGKLAIAKVDKAAQKPKASAKPKFTF